VARQLKIELDLDSSGFTAKITDASGGVRKFNTAVSQTAKSVQNMERRVHGLLATTRDLTLILSQARTAIYNMRTVFTGWIESIVATNIQIERMTYLLANMSSGLTVTERFKEAGDNLDYLFAKAKNAPFSINALTDSFVKMKSVGIDPAAGALDSLTDSVAAFGGTDDVLKRASVAIQQMGGKGVISMEELRQQLGEAVPNAVVLMARSMGLTYKELVDKISKGQVEAGSALGKMFGEFERAFGGASQRLMDSFGGKLSVLKTNLIEFATTVGGLQEGQAGFGEGSFMATLTTQLDRLVDIAGSPNLKVFAANLGTGLASSINVLVKVVGYMVQYKDAIIAAGKAFAIYLGSQIVVGTLNSMKTAALAAATQFSMLGGAFTKAGAGASLFGTAVQMMSLRMVTAGAGAKALGQGLAMIGKGLFAALGPIGLFVSAAFFAADAMGFFKDRTAEARQAVADFNRDLFSQEGLDSLTEGVKNADAEIQKLQKSRQGARNKQSDFREKGQSFDTKEDIDKKIKELQAQREQYLLQIERGLPVVIQQRTDSDLAIAERSIQRQVGNVRSAYAKAGTEIDLERVRIADDKNLSTSQRQDAELDLNARYAALIKQSYQEEIDVYQSYADELVAIGGALKDGAAVSTFNETIIGNAKTTDEAIARVSSTWEGVSARIIELRANAASAEAIAASANKILDSSKDGDTEKTAAIVTRLNSMRAKVAELGAEYEGTSGEVAKFNQQVLQGQYKDATAAQVKEGRELAQTIDATTEALKRQTSNDNLNKRLSTEFERATAAADAMILAITGGMSEAEAETARYNETVNQITRGITDATSATLDMADATKLAFLTTRGAEYANQLKQQTVTIETGILRQRAAKEADYAADLTRIDEIIDLSRYSGEARVAIEKIVADYKDARHRQFVEESKTGFQKMLDNWMDTTEAMDGAQQKWLGDFTDGLIEGELNFKDFTVSILKDIAKIIIRAQIAAALTAAIGAITGSFGGGSNAVQGPATGGLAGTIYHSGGIVGESVGGTRSMSAGLLAMAKRYHSGGFPGLKNDEVPAILQKGERVSTVQEQRAGNAGAGLNVYVNITNESGQEMQEQSRQQAFDGESYVIDIVTAAAGRPGKMRSAMKEAANG
jgi:tape measure domain-containing protein